MSYPPKEYYEEDARMLRRGWVRVGWVVRGPLAAAATVVLLLWSIFAIRALDVIPEVWEWAIYGGDVTI